jgi:tetratricopeptide (TPR) repeat protein
LLVCLALATVSLPVLAQRAGTGPRDEAPAASASAPLTEDQQKAQEHFKKAKELYLAGKYNEAIVELEIAKKLDPKAKDLVFNLGIVHEKLGKFEEAIAFFRTYMEMEGVTGQERTKAEGIIKRIEGAKHEVPPTPSSSAAPTPSATTTTPNPNDRPERGRIDAATIAAGSIAIVALGVGTFFGVRAVTTRPDNFVTGRDGSYANLQEKSDDAHTSAIIADIGIGVGIVAVLATAYLYFGRTKDPARIGTATGLSNQPFFLGGTFR